MNVGIIFDSAFLRKTLIISQSFCRFKKGVNVILLHKRLEVNSWLSDSTCSDTTGFVVSFCQNLRMEATVF